MPQAMLSAHSGTPPGNMLADELLRAMCACS